MDRRRLLIWLAAIIAAVLIVVLLWRFIQGSTTVSVDQKDATISLVTPGQPEKEIGRGSATVRGSGDYTLLVRYDQSETLVTVRVNKFHHESKKAVLYEPVEPAKFYEATAKAFAVRGKYIRLINQSSLGIIEVDTAKNTTRTLASNWPTPERGVWHDFYNAFFVGGYNTPLVMSNNTMKYLSLGEDDSTSEFYRNPTYPVGMNDVGEMSMIFNGRLAYYTNLSARPRFIREGLDNNSDVYLSNLGDSLYVVKPELEVESEKADQTNIVRVFDKNGEVLHEAVVEGNDYIKTAAWSPNGERMLWLTPNGLYIVNKALDTSQLLSAGYGTVTSMLWLDDSSVLYIADNQIWRANVDTKDIHKLSRPLEGTNPLGSVFKDQNKIYFATESTTSYATGAVYEFTLPTN